MEEEIKGKKVKNSVSSSLIVHKNLTDSKSILELIENVKKIRQKTCPNETSGKKLKTRASKSKNKIQNISKKKRDSDDFVTKKGRIFQSYDNVAKAPKKLRLKAKGNLNQFNTFSEIIQAYPFPGMHKSHQAMNKNNSKGLIQSRNKKQTSSSKTKKSRMRRKKNINLKNFFVNENGKTFKMPKKKGRKQRKLRNALKDVIGDDNDEVNLSMSLKQVAKQAKFLKQFRKSRATPQNHTASKKSILKSGKKSQKMKMSQNFEKSRSKKKRRDIGRAKENSKSKSKLRIKNTRKLVNKFNSLKKENIILRQVLKKSLLYLSKSDMRGKVYHQSYYYLVGRHTKGYPWNSEGVTPSKEERSDQKEDEDHMQEGHVAEGKLFE